MGWKLSIITKLLSSVAMKIYNLTLNLDGRGYIDTILSNSSSVEQIDNLKGTL